MSNLTPSRYYHIYYMTSGIYKIVGFKRSPEYPCRIKTSDRNIYDKKLDNSLSRSRRLVLEKGLCNEWSYFCTFTLDKSKYDRFDLGVFRSDLSEFVKYNRKKYPDLEFRYLFVPEQHKDGAWHIHGLFSDISPLLVSFADLRLSGVSVPDKLVNGGYFNWCDYQNKFGHCSFGKIRDSVATAFYITKYISKSLAETDIGLGSHCFFASKGLNAPERVSVCFGSNMELERYITNHYEFCSLGMTKRTDGLDWTFPLQFDSEIDFDKNGFYEPMKPVEAVCPEWTAMQLCLKGCV